MIYPQLANYKELLRHNPFDSESLDDVKYYTHNFGVTRQREFQYFGREEEENKHLWKHGDFRYKLNEYGFRFENCQASVDVGAFGCSYTFGQALPTEMLWHTLIGKKLGKTVCNFGISGAGILTILDIFCIVSKHIKMKDALFLLPTLERMQIAKCNQDKNFAMLNVIPGHKSLFNEAYDFDGSELYKYLPEEELIKQIKNSLHFAEIIAKDRNINMYISTWDNFTYHVLKSIRFKHIKMLPLWWSQQDIINDKARDNRHPGPAHHQVFAHKIINDSDFNK